MYKSNIPGDLSTIPLNTAPLDLELLRQNGKVYKENASATILDIGDNIGLIEFHTKANALSDDVCEIILAACETGDDRFEALVIGNYGRHFSAGANLGLVLELARKSDWNALDHTIRTLQKANMAIKYGKLPVVAAPFSSALGGGCEVCLHSAFVVAASSTHMGLVEAGVGLIPAGGGTKELGLRASDLAAASNEDSFPRLQEVLNYILTAKVSHSGNEARDLFLKPEDLVVESDQSCIQTAKQVALKLARDRYGNGTMRTDIPVAGRAGIRTFQMHIKELYDNKTITEHDSIIAMHLATILCGGEQDKGVASEQYFLDLEREAFMSLLGTQKTQERIAYLLQNNKPLHN